MNIIKRATCVLVAVTGLFLTSCDDDDNGNMLPSDNLAINIIQENPEYSIFSEALQITSLDASLNQRNDVTVFVPTNNAFNQFFTATGFASINDVPLTQLRSIIQYHLLNDEFTTDLFTTDYIKTLSNDDQGNSLDLYIDTTTGIVLNGFANIIASQSDINADNGVVHTIDRVLSLPTVAQLISANANRFSNLNTALVSVALDNTLSTEDGSMQGPFTVFAPTNDAFQTFIDEDTMDQYDNFQDILDDSDLANILLYHVKGAPTLRSADFTDGQNVTSITGDTFLINTTSGNIITDGQSRAIMITTVNITASNGVIHAVDNVLLRP
jgi:uncharacterized surface protein with fasciclin (FAS1) repeats